MNGLRTTAVLIACSGLAGMSCRAPRGPKGGAPVVAFTVTKSLILGGEPTTVFDAFTGDVSGWWDHHFSKKPVRLFIEPKPGGRFMEVFDAAGNGAVHATVIFVERGKRLRLTGPMGLSGKAVNLVHNFEFVRLPGGRTRLLFELQGLGAIKPQWVAAISRVWDHFLFKRFKPHFESSRRRLSRAGDH